MTLHGKLSLLAAALLAAVGLVHVLLPDLAWRWRVHRPLDDLTRPGVRMLGVALLGFGALVAAVVFTVF